MHNFKELKIWQRAIELTEDVYKLLVKYPDYEKYGLTSQIRRSVVSVPSNIAEGSGRASNRDFRRFLAISLSSAFELETQLILSNKFEFISEKEFKNLSAKLQELQKMIFGFRKSLSNTTNIKNLIISYFY